MNGNRASKQERKYDQAPQESHGCSIHSFSGLIYKCINLDVEQEGMMHSSLTTGTGSIIV